VTRLQGIVEPNSFVISPITHRLVGALFDYRDLERHTLKGFSEPVHVRQVLGAEQGREPVRGPASVGDIVPTRPAGGA